MPSWAMNLSGFGLLIALVLAVFFWQMTASDHELHRNTLGRSQMIAAIIEESLRTATLAGTTVDTIVTSMLLDKARFIDYLHGVDPLQTEELAALARETGLLGIGLIQTDGTIIVGPEQWGPIDPACSGPLDAVRYDPNRQVALLTTSAANSSLRCIQIGFQADAILGLQQQTSLATLLATLSTLPGIHSIRLEKGTEPTGEDSVRLLTDQGRPTAEVRMATAMGLLVVGLDATNHANRIGQMRRQFLLFAALLSGLGLFFSWLLYRAQKADLNRTRTFERLLAREHEAAALGRATATIAHEVRNPLNAISMGLQRFTLESPHLDAEQRQLLAAMEEAVRRATSIVGELQRFTRKLVPRPRPVDPVAILRTLLSLYRQRCIDQGIEITIDAHRSFRLEADQELLTELLENLLKNSIEAQPGGGFIRIELVPLDQSVTLTMTNGGCNLTVDQIERLGEPYFTTKTRGSGLGLALCRRIAEAHGGTLDIAVDRDTRHLTVTLLLPGQQRDVRPEVQTADPQSHGGPGS